MHPFQLDSASAIRNWFGQVLNLMYRVSLGNIEPQIKLFLRSIVSDIASSVSKFRTGSMLKRSVFRFFSREVEVHTVHTSKIPKQLGQKQI